jgi:hypothetical protein
VQISTAEFNYLETKYGRYGHKTKYGRYGHKTEYGRYGHKTEYGRYGHKTKYGRYGHKTKFSCSPFTQVSKRLNSAFHKQAEVFENGKRIKVFVLCKNGGSHSGFFESVDILDSDSVPLGE